MTRKKLQAEILRMLAYPAFPTEDGLIAALVAAGYRSSPQHACRARGVLLDLVAAGKAERQWDREIERYRYRMLGTRYRIRSVSGKWHVDREHPHIPDHWITIVSATESEAVTCLRALDPHASTAP